jgi:hypothetical protein
MNRWGFLVLAVCVLVAGCGDDNGTSPSAAPLVFTATLSPANEVPPVGNTEGGGSGNVQVTFEGSTVAFYFQLTDFPSDTRVVGAHIHAAGPGVNGPIVVSTNITNSTAVPMTPPITEFRVSGIDVVPATLQAIAANPGGFYFNVHSPLNPGGFARGQLRRIQ